MTSEIKEHEMTQVEKFYPFRVSTKDIKSIISKISSTIKPRNHSEIFSFYKVSISNEKFSITAMNDVFAKQVSSPIECFVFLDGTPSSDEEYSFCVDARKLNTFISVARGKNIQFLTHDKKVQLRSGASKVFLPVFSGDDFPQLPMDSQSSQEETVSSDDLKYLYEFGSSSVSKDLTRPVLTGVNHSFQSNSFTASTSDGISLSRCSILASLSNTFKDMDAVTIPMDAIQSILKDINSSEGETVTIGLLENAVIYSFDNVKIFARLIEGAFPNQVLDITSKMIQNKQSHHLAIRKSILVEAIRVSSISKDNTSLIFKYSPSRSMLRMTSHGSSTSDFQMDAVVKGEGDDICFQLNVNHLSSLLNTFDDSDVIYIGADNNTSPFSVRLNLNSATDLHVLMPTRMRLEPEKDEEGLLSFENFDPSFDEDNDEDDEE